MTAAGDEIPESLQRRLDELAASPSAAPPPVVVTDEPAVLSPALQQRLDELAAAGPPAPSTPLPVALDRLESAAIAAGVPEVLEAVAEVRTALAGDQR